MTNALIAILNHADMSKLTNVWMIITDVRLWIQILVSHQIINVKTEIQIQYVLILKRIIAFRLNQNH